MPRAPLVDYHIHSTFSEDARSTPREIIEVALERGLDQVMFTEHLEFPPSPDYPEVAFFPERVLPWAEYQEALSGLGQVFGPRIEIGIGAELGLEPHNLDAWEPYSAEHQPAFDFVLGSLHAVGGRLVQMPEFSRDSGADGAATVYFDQLLAAVRRAVAMGACDALGHVDLVKRSPSFGRFRLESYRERLEALFEVIIPAGVGLEVNTSGYRQPPGEPYPGLETLRLYRESGGEVVTIGSDSHVADTVGQGSAEALDLVRAAGFSHLTLFRERKPRFVRL